MEMCIYLFTYTGSWRGCVYVCVFLWFSRNPGRHAWQATSCCNEVVSCRLAIRRCLKRKQAGWRSEQKSCWHLTSFFMKSKSSFDPKRRFINWWIRCSSIILWQSFSLYQDIFRTSLQSKSFSLCVPETQLTPRIIVSLSCKGIQAVNAAGVSLLFYFKPRVKWLLILAVLVLVLLCTTCVYYRVLHLYLFLAVLDCMQIVYPFFSFCLLFEWYSI